VTVKDSVAGRYWQFSPEESLILLSLDGTRGTDDIRARFEREFAPRRLPSGQLYAFLARLHREGLTVSDRPGQTEAVADRQREHRRGAPLRFLNHLLWWRFRGIDPDRWLERVIPRCRWIFTAPSVAIFAALVISSLLLVLFRWPALDREIQLLRGSFSAVQLLWVLAVIGLVKVLHEFGHAVACKHYGGQCHEMGLMLFLGAPALYCNVSDAWMLSDKRSRIIISASGILVEIALAAVCAWIWHASAPGLVHSLALYVMIACSVNTLLLNGNPLLQFDGYYVLADISNTPNLRAEAGAAVRRFAARALLGLRVAPTGFIRGRGAPWLVVYGIASVLYRWSVMLAALWFLHYVLEPYGMQAFSWIAGVVLIGGMLTEPVTDLVRSLARAGYDGQTPWRWVVPRSAIVCALAALALVIPLPCRVVCPVSLEPRNARTVYVEVDGTLQWSVGPGRRVQQGDVLARLENLPLAAEVARLEGDRNVRQRRLQNLLRRQADPAAAALIPTGEKSLADAEERLLQRRRDLARLEIRAPRAGIVLPPPARDTGDDSMPTWRGTPFDEHNRGCYLKTGDALCVIAEPNDVDALAFVGEDIRDWLAVGQAAAVFVHSAPHRQIAGAVAIAPTSPTKTIPDELLVRGELASELASPRGPPRPKGVIYAARIELTLLDQPLMPGTTGSAKVAVAPQSLAARAWRGLRQTFGGR
jgi:putative peptide zinc metalloprotease protein